MLPEALIVGGVYSETRGEKPGARALCILDTKAKLKHASPLTRRQNLLVMERTFQSTFCFPSGIVPWSWKNITTLERMWLRAYKIVWGLHAGTASDILTRPREEGGLQVRLPLSVLTCTLWTHLVASTNSDDGLKELAYLEYSEALNKYHCSDLRERRLRSSSIPGTPPSITASLTPAMCSGSSTSRFTGTPLLRTPLRDRGPHGQARSRPRGCTAL
jgi:hypothetical protein